MGEVDEAFGGLLVVAGTDGSDLGGVDWRVLRVVPEGTHPVNFDYFVKVVWVEVRESAKSFMRSEAAGRALEAAGVVAVSGGDVGVTVQTHDADGQAAQ